MKQYFPYIIIAILIVLLFWRGCGDKELPDNSKHIKDSIQLHQAKVENEVLILKGLAKTQTDTIYKDRHHYHTIRKDSMIPCETKLTLADTIIVHDSIHDITQDLIIVKQDSVIKDLRAVHGLDSVQVVTLTQANKKLRRQNFWLKAANVAQAVLNGWQAVRRD